MQRLLVGFMCAGYEIWPNNVTDKTMRRITEQNLFVQAYARQRNESGLIFCCLPRVGLYTQQRISISKITTDHS